jgi:hypothetical protein
VDLTKVPKKEVGRTFKLVEAFIRDRDAKKKRNGDNTAMVAGGKFPIFLTLIEFHIMLNCVLKVLS